MAIATKLAGCAGVLALAAAAGAGAAQVDPFGTLYGAPVQSQSQGGRSQGGPGHAAATVGVQSVSAAVGRSYAGSQEKGTTSLAQVAMLPGTLQPLPVALDGASEKYLKGRAKIAVPAYAFALQRDASMSASAAGQGSDITPRRTTLSSHLQGISDELAAQLAQEAYDDLVGRLRAAGFEVVPAEEAMAAPHIRALSRYAGPAPAKDGWTVYGAASAPAIRGYAFETGLGGLSAPGALLNLGQASKELDAVLLTPQLMINHIGMGGTGQRNYVGSASVDARLRFSVASPSRVPFVWGNERGGAMPGVFIAKPSGTDELFAIMVQTEDRSDDPGLHNAFAEAGMGSIYRQSLVYAVQADPGRFAALCRAAFQGFNTALVEQIRRARAS